jgi:hypothetical protein
MASTPTRAAPWLTALMLVALAGVVFLWQAVARGGA